MYAVQAVLVGVDHSTLAPPLRGAVQDVLDLAERLLARGVPPDALHLATSPTLPDDILPGVPRTDASVNAVQDALARAAAHLDDDAPTLVHVSARGRADGQVLLADGCLPAAAFSAPFADQPIRSVAVVLDVGFRGGPTPGERTWGPVGRSPELPSPSDPTLLAGGLSGIVLERSIAGTCRGVFSRFLSTLLDDPETASWSFAEVLAVLRRVPGEQLDPMILPATDASQLVGAPVPWRGVGAAFQWQPTHDVIGNAPIFFANTDREQFDFGSGTAFPANQFTVTTHPGVGSPIPPGPGVSSFTNHAFDLSAPVPTPPSVTASDRVYVVTASWGLPGALYVVVRNAAAGAPQGAEWYTTATMDRLDVADGTLTFTGASLPDAAAWGQAGPWYGALQQTLP